MIIIICSYNNTMYDNYYNNSAGPAAEIGEGLT
jgi:hypothetical protein